LGKSDLEEAFAGWIRILKMPVPIREHRFHAARKWRFDFAWPEFMVAVEIEGGVWMQGGHNRGRGYIEDCEKYNFAAAEKWTVYRFADAKLIINGDAARWLKERFPKRAA